MPPAADEPVLGVVAVRARAVGGQVAVRIVGERRGAGAGILVEVVDADS